MKFQLNIFVRAAPSDPANEHVYTYDITYTLT